MMLMSLCLLKKIVSPFFPKDIIITAYNSIILLKEGAALPFASNYIMTALFGPHDDRNPISQLKKRRHDRRYLQMKDVKDKNILVIGIGGIGSLAVQILTSLGAKVDVVCSTEAANLAGKLGVNNIYDYEKCDFLDDLVDEITERTAGQKYNFVIDAARSDSTEDSSISWIWRVIDRNDTVVVGFNSPETAIKDATAAPLGRFSVKEK
jgi:NADPH:quinone reductase-like Zn-dependent oxidoreductase